MKKVLFTLLALVVLNVSGFSQTMFQQVYQRDSSMIFGGQQTMDGGYIMGGLSSVTPTDVNFMAVKTNSIGDTIWTKTYGGNGDEESYAMQQTADGGYIFVGIDSSSGLGNYNVYAVKTDANGDTLWTKSYGGSDYDFGQAVQQTADGGYIIAGYTGSFGAGGPDVYLLKITSNGTLTWSKTYGGIYGDKAWAVKQAADGGYIVAGITSSFGVTPYGNINDVFLIKTDASGNITWNKTYGRGGDDWGYGVVQTYDGGYAVTGFASHDSLDTGSEVYLFKTDSNGDTLFTKSFGGITGGTNYNQGFAIIQTNDSGLAVGGSSYSFGYGASDLYLLKTDKNGNFIFNSTFGAHSNDFAYAIGQAADSGFVLGGYTNNYGVDSSSFYLVKTDKNGNSSNCNQTSPTPIILSGGLAIINTPTVVVTNPATMVTNNTHTQIKSGLSVMSISCPTTSIKKSVSEKNYLYTVYPNPNNGNFIFKTNTPIDNVQLSIYNQLGQVVLKQQLTDELTNINLPANSGVYQVRIVSGNELIYQTKIIKE